MKVINVGPVSDGQHAGHNQGCPLELPPQEGAVENHDKTSAISGSIALPSKTKDKCPNKKQQKKQGTNRSAKLMELLTQQTHPKDGEAELSSIDPVSGGLEPSTMCRRTARVEITNPAKTQGTRKQQKHPVIQHPVVEKACPKPFDTIAIPCHEGESTNMDVGTPPKIKHKRKRNYRRLNENQRAQHQVAINASIKTSDVPINQPMISGAKEVHWGDSVDVEHVECESPSCVPSQEGPASLQERSLEHQMNAKSLHYQRTSHLISPDLLHLKDFSSTVSYLNRYCITSIPFIDHVAQSTLSCCMNFKLIETSKIQEVTPPVTVGFISSFDLSRQPRIHRRFSLSDLQGKLTLSRRQSFVYPYLIFM